MDSVTFRDICFAQKEDQKRSDRRHTKERHKLNAFHVITWRNKERNVPIFLMLRVTVIPYLCTTFSGLCAQKTWKDPEAPRMLCENVGPLTGKLPSGTWWHLTPTTANPEGHSLDSFPLSQGKSGLRTFTLYVPHPHNQYRLGLAPHLFPWISMTSYLTSLCLLEPFLISNHMFLKKKKKSRTQRKLPDERIQIAIWRHGYHTSEARCKANEFRNLEK